MQNGLRYGEWLWLGVGDLLWLLWLVVVDGPWRLLDSGWMWLMISDV